VSGGAFRFVQPTPAPIWGVQHNLGFWANITCVDTTGRVIVPDISYGVDPSVIYCNFSAPVAGEAYVS